MLKNYFKTALRNLFRNKVYSFINAAGLSLGLACAMLILLYVKDEVSFDRFHKEADHIYTIGRKLTRPNGDLAYSGSTGYFQGPRFKEAIPEIREFVRFQEGFRDIKNGTDIQSQQVCYTDPGFFSVFSFPLLQGDAKTALTDPYSAVVSEEMAKKQFGTTDVVGKTILLKQDDQFIPYSITAVSKRCPQNSSLKFSVLLPMVVSVKDQQRNENWFNSFLNTFVLLTPNADIKAVEAKMKKVFAADASEAIQAIKEKYGVKDIGITHFLQSFTSLHLDTRLISDGGISDTSNPIFSYILSGIALFILLIACINFVNLSLARSLKRAKEIGVRKVVGGNRKQLILQFLGESFVLCLMAFVFAIIIVKLSLPAFNTLSNKALSFTYLLDAKLVAGYIGLFLLTTFLAGFYPALVLSNYNPVQTLYKRIASSGTGLLHRSLVVTQFTLASFLIIATIIIFLQFNFLTHEELGYNESNLVTVDMNHWGGNPVNTSLVKQELMKSTGIIEIAAKNSGQWGTTAKVNTDKQVNFTFENIDEAFLPLLKIPVIKGRNFSADFPSDSTQSVLINEAFAREAGWKEPIGQQVGFFDNEDKYTVVGMVKDYHFRPVTEKISPQVFSLKPDEGNSLFLVKIKPNSEAATLPFIEKTFKSLFPLDPYSFSFKDQQNKQDYEAEAKWKQILLFAAILTIFISCIGLFGLSVSAAEKRRKEIGIRKVLGASVSSVVTTLAKDFLKLVILAMLLAIPFAWMAADKWLENYPYRITLSWWQFATAGILVLLIAVITVSFQAIRAAVANPVRSLGAD